MEKRFYDFAPAPVLRPCTPAPRRTRPARHARRRRKKRLFPLACAAVCLCLALTYGWTMAADALKGAVRSGVNAVASMLPVDLGGAWDADTCAAIAQLAQEHPEAQAMLDAPEHWPAEVAALAARNPEALGFVLAWPDIQNDPPVDRVAEAQPGVFPTLLQWDARWGCASYGGSILALSGCGPTVLSVVVCGLTGQEQWTPAAIASWAQEHGYAGAFGTSWELMSEGCGQFGLVSEEVPLTESVVRDTLAAGHPVICSMRPGDFTTSGHFIVLTGVEDGMIRLIDPNSPARTETLWDYDDLAPQIKNLWAYTAPAFA